MINPKYPVYIVSKGRATTGHTRKSLARMNVPHYIAIEPQDYEDYAKEVDPKQLLVLPFSNHGDGPGRARNWCWDHAISLGAERHWVLDDNIHDFYRLNNYKRTRVESGAIFRAAEDFVDRYTNVPVSGFQYRFFIAPNAYYPPYVKNTRIYSCLLIHNKCKYRWRGRYNEDTDLSLRVLKDGDCTVQFNAFLQGKAANQTVKGGNTAEFYHKENPNLGATAEDEVEKYKKTGYSSQGTINKSQMLVDMHPDVSRLSWRFGRWHHYVNYEPFKKNKLILKDDVNISDGINNYNLVLCKTTKEGKFIEKIGE